MLRSVRVTGLVAVLAGIPAVGYAAPGDLDPTFGAGGAARLLIATDSEVNAGVLQPDGKAVLVGAGMFDFRVRRFGTDGLADPLFPSLHHTDFNGGFDAASAVVLLPDGRVVVGGSAGDAPAHARFGLARFQSDGALDASFGTGGKVQTSFGPTAGVFALALQSDGMLIAGGGVGGQFALARYDSAGALDPGFGAGGIVTTATSGPVRALVLQPDGSIVAAGGTTSFVLARYDSAGALDATFGVGGIATTPTGGAARALVGDGLGRLVAAGGTGVDFAVARYDAGGTLDGGFGTGGVATTDFGGLVDEARALDLAPDGTIVAGGNAGVPGGTRFALVRHRDDGTLDPGFGSGGGTTVDMNPNLAGIVGLLRRPDGRLVGVGSASNFNNPVGFELASFFAGACGNNVLEYGEDCDDGNVLDGDGCDQHCCTLDADADGVCDAVDACAVPAVVAKAKVIVAGLNRPVERHQLTVKGELTLPYPFTPPLPQDVRFIVTDAIGTVLDASLGGGGLAPPNGRWKYLTTTQNAPYPNVPLAATDRILRVTMQDKSVRRPGVVTFTIISKGDPVYATLAANPPLAATVVLAPPFAATGQCGSVSFPGPLPGPACVLNTTGTKLTCK